MNLRKRVKNGQFLLILLSAIGAFAQSVRDNQHVQTLSYSGIELKLGDQEQSTVELLRTRFTVQLYNPEPKTKDVNYLVTRGKSPVQIIGVMTFRGGRLVKAYRDWTPDEVSSYALVVALRGAVDAMKGDSPCKLDTSSVQEPNYLNQSSSVICGNKYLEVSAIESSRLNNKTAVSIYEWLTDFSD
jgi:hypothetical protein